jgi:IclR family transcriptional regulator, KDG regulon repressor
MATRSRATDRQPPNRTDALAVAPAGQPSASPGNGAEAQGSEPVAEPPTTSGKHGGAAPRTLSRSTERAVALLTCFTPEAPRHRVADLAEQLGMHPSSVYRYVMALEAADLLERDVDYGGYRLGLGVLELSSIVLRDLDVRRFALDELDRLSEETGLLANLGLLKAGKVIHVAHAFPPGWPRWNMDLGHAALAHCTSLGKVLLAALPWEEALQHVEQVGWRGYTANCLQDSASLKAELQEVARRGYAVDNEERSAGAMCVGVPIFGQNGDVRAAMSVSGTTIRINELGVDKCAATLLIAARRVSSQLGSPDRFTAYL